MVVDDVGEVISIFECEFYGEELWEEIERVGIGIISPGNILHVFALDSETKQTIELCQWERMGETIIWQN